ncbi:MAG: trimeric intracellular cation channel family protein [Phyllobacteriaceae bacterium]|nr:trimeric intracellular cation channel family protein [Phyllobacteriaceae bacterium]
MFLTLLDLAGGFAFALSGGTRAVERRFDLFGIVFLAFVAATAGGIVRDVLIGAVPPAAIASWPSAAVAVLAGLVASRARGLIARLATPVTVFDAVGLGFFAVVGTRKALDAGLTPVMAALLGMLTAIGGGIGRDVLTAEPPMVLRREIYALAALLGGAVVVLGDAVGWSNGLSATVGAVAATGLRLTALRFGWNLPRG